MRLTFIDPDMGRLRPLLKSDDHARVTLIEQKVQEVPGLADHRENKEDPLEVQYAPVHEVELVPGGELYASGVFGPGMDAVAEMPTTTAPVVEEAPAATTSPWLLLAGLAAAGASAWLSPWPPASPCRLALSPMLNTAASAAAAKITNATSIFHISLSPVEYLI
jgi:hypothetical protein